MLKAFKLPSDLEINSKIINIVQIFFKNPDDFDEVFDYFECLVKTERSQGSQNQFIGESENGTTFCTDIHSYRRRNPEDFGVLLTLPLVPHWALHLKHFE